MLIALASLPGCYLAHVAGGQTRLLCGRRPVAEVLEDPATPGTLRRKLGLVEAARDQAVELGLDVGEQYTSYVAWPGDRVVTSVVATRPGEVEPAGFWFPILGRVPYKSFFEIERAEREASRLRARGLDVCLSAIPAYSTLGWFDDPVTDPMLRNEDGLVVETIVHELVHATFYVPNQPEFNEGVASFIGQEAAIRFAERAAEGSEAAARERRRVTDDRRIARALLAVREQVEALYRTTPEPDRAEGRARIEERARESLAALPLAERDAARIARRLRLNDACLALTGTYEADAERYAERLEALGGDLNAFAAEARRAAESSDPRAALLAN